MRVKIRKYTAVPKINKNTREKAKFFGQFHVRISHREETETLPGKMLSS